jgi:hypothetical protein
MGQFLVAAFLPFGRGTQDAARIVLIDVNDQAAHSQFRVD